MVEEGSRQQQNTQSYKREHPVRHVDVRHVQNEDLRDRDRKEGDRGVADRRQAEGKAAQQQRHRVQGPPDGPAHLDRLADLPVQSVRLVEEPFDLERAAPSDQQAGDDPQHLNHGGR